MIDLKYVLVVPVGSDRVLGYFEMKELCRYDYSDQLSVRREVIGLTTKIFDPHSTIIHRGKDLKTRMRSAE